MADVVWIARHGNRQDFVDPAWAATAERPGDPGLSDDGVEQVERLAERLVPEGLTHIFSSPFLRCVQTASAVAERVGLPIKLEWGICEWLSPQWFDGSPETLPVEELHALFPRVDVSYRSILHPRFPEESPAAFRRSGDTVRRLSDEYAGHLLFVGHGISVTGGAQGLVADCPAFECHLASLVKAVRDEHGWHIELLADTAHLEEAIGADRFV